VPRPRLRQALRKWRRPQLALLALLVIVVAGYGINALRGSGSSSSSDSVSVAATTIAPQSASATTSGTLALSSLPPAVTQTIELIKAGGPFPYRQDGVVFDNNEKLLPLHRRGYYHEYTVPTPGASDRATRRIITGSAGEYFYTSDHYASFHRIDPNR